MLVPCLLDARQRNIWIESAESASHQRFNEDYQIETPVWVQTSQGLQATSLVRPLQGNRQIKDAEYVGGVHGCLHSYLEWLRRKATAGERCPQEVSLALWERLIECEHPFPVEKEAREVYSSNVPDLLGDYEDIIGITGTAGSTQERSEIEKLYGVTVWHKVPSHCPSRRLDLPPQLCGSPAHQVTELQIAIKAAQDKGQPVLVVCENDSKTEGLMAELGLQEILESVP